MDPFTILNVPLDCDDAQVRRAWQAAVQSNPPEKNPDRFQAVQEAGKALATARERWQVRLHLPPPAGAGPLQALVDYLRLTGRSQPVGARVLREWISLCSGTEESRRASAVGLEAARLRGKNRKGNRQHR